MKTTLYSFHKNVGKVDYFLYFTCYQLLSLEEEMEKTYRYWAFSLSNVEDEEESLFSENMTEFEKAISFINAGKCRLSDAAVKQIYGIKS